MNDNCDLTVGPCACGAWHSESEINYLKNKGLKVEDFQIGESVIWHTQQYNCDTKDYTPIKRMAIVTKLGEHGVTIETERGQNPDYNMHIGKYCLNESLEKIPQGNVTVLRKRAK